MPGAFTHLLTGRAAQSLLKPESLPAYWLGCVVPDAPNLDGFASKEVRWRSHLRDKDTERWMSNVSRFLLENKGRADHSCLLGYAVHAAGDAVWDEAFEKKLVKAIHAEELPWEERFHIRWNEHHRFEQEQLSADWWMREVRPQLAQAVPKGINGIDRDLAERYRDYLLTDYNPAQDGKAAGFVTMRLVQEFSEKVVKKLKEYQIGKVLRESGAAK